MKTPKLLKRVQEFIDSDKLKQCMRRDCIKEVLHKLKKKQRMLKEKLAKEKNEKERSRIQKALDNIYVHRHKGLKALKSLKKS
jgi:regulator of sirC expression with transglutaminase-like and TPR domain